MVSQACLTRCDISVTVSSTARYLQSLTLLGCAWEPYVHFSDVSQETRLQIASLFLISFSSSLIADGRPISRFRALLCCWSEFLCPPLRPARLLPEGQELPGEPGHGGGRPASPLGFFGHQVLKPQERTLEKPQARTPHNHNVPDCSIFFCSTFYNSVNDPAR